MAVGVGQDAFVALSVALLAPALELPSMVAYLGAISVMSMANYLALASRVSHSHPV